MRGFDSSLFSLSYYSYKYFTKRVIKSVFIKKNFIYYYYYRNFRISLAVTQDN